MANELKHGSVGTSLSQAEWEGIGTHVVEGQLTGDLIYASSSTQLRRLQISGTSTHILGISGGVPAWTAPVAPAAGSLTGSTLASGVVTTSITTVGALNAGSITSGFGTINTGSSSITTTGTVTGGNLAGTLNTAAQTSVTSVGALNGGTITSGFGSIDNGSSTITTTGAADLGATTVDSLSVSDGDITNVGDIALDTISADGTDITIQPSGVVFMKPSGMTSNYAFTDRSDVMLVLQNQTAGGTSQLEIYTADGDSTDQVGISIWPYGTPGSITNRELLNIRYTVANTRFQIETEDGGTGTARNLAIVDNGSDWMEFVADGGVEFSKAANVYINDSANANSTTGLTVNQGAADNQVLAFKSSDINTGFTDGTDRAVEVDDYATFQKRSATIGGLLIQAIAEDAVSNRVFTVSSYGGQANVAKTTAAEGLIHLEVAESNGSNALENITSEGNVFAITARVGGSYVCRFLVDEDGDMYSVTSGQTFDKYDDLALVDSYDSIRNDYSDFTAEHEAELIKLGILGAPVAEGGMTNTSQLQRLHNGAIRQLAGRLEDALTRLGSAENKLSALEANNGDR
jgi:hypothetical protein